MINTDNSCGIYCIENVKDGKKYIGKYKGKIKYRLNSHIAKLKENKHSNKYLQRSWNKNGNKNFKFYVLCFCENDELNEKEKFYIAKYKSNNSEYGYNLTSGGDGFGDYLKGIPKSKKHKDKLSKVMKGKYDGSKNPFYNLKHSSATKELMSKKAKIRYVNMSKKEKRNLIKNLYSRGTEFYTKNSYEKLRISKIGENSPSSKLLEREVIEILKSKKTLVELSKKYKVSQSSVSRIKSGKRWSYLKERYPDLYD